MACSRGTASAGSCGCAFVLASRGEGSVSICGGRRASRVATSRGRTAKAIRSRLLASCRLIGTAAMSEAKNCGKAVGTADFQAACLFGPSLALGRGRGPATFSSLYGLSSRSNYNRSSV